MVKITKIHGYTLKYDFRAIPRKIKCDLYSLLVRVLNEADSCRLRCRFGNYFLGGVLSGYLG